MASSPASSHSAEHSSAAHDHLDLSLFQPELEAQEDSFPDCRGDSECRTVLRLLQCLDYYYALLIMTPGTTDYGEHPEDTLTAFCDEHYQKKAILRDYIHFLCKHSERASMRRIQEKLHYRCDAVECCNVTLRHFGGGKAAKKWNHYIETMDCLHFYLCHTEEVGLRVPMEVLQSEMTAKEEPQDDAMIQSMFQRMGSEITARTSSLNFGPDGGHVDGGHVEPEEASKSTTNYTSTSTTPLTPSPTVCFVDFGFTVNNVVSLWTKRQQIGVPADEEDDDQSVWWRTEIESLRRQIEGKEEEIGTLRSANGDLEAAMDRLTATERGHLSTISVMEEEAVRGQSEEMNLLRAQQSSIEEHRLDSAAIEMELSGERIRTQQLRVEQTEIEEALYAEKERVSEMEQTLRNYEEQKMALIQSTNEQMNQLREYLLFYQRYFHEQTERARSVGNNENDQ